MRFYFAWAAAVVLALVLPIALPYAIWPPHEGRHVDVVTECGRRAEIDAVRAQHPVASLWPLSNSVHSCSRDEAGVLTYSADVTAHGPYGIPFATARVTSGNINWHDKDSGAALGLAALLLGAAGASMPFVIMRIQRRLRTMQPAVA